MIVTVIRVDSDRVRREEIEKEMLMGKSNPEELLLHRDVVHLRWCELLVKVGYRMLNTLAIFL